MSSSDDHQLEAHENVRLSVAERYSALSIGITSRWPIVAITPTITTGHTRASRADRNRT